MSKTKKAYLTQQQTKDKQINFLLGDIEKNLKEYRRNLELKEKQPSDAKKILVSAKQSYDKTVAENKELKAYIESLKQSFQGLQQQQQAQILEQQKNYYQQKRPNSKKCKKVGYEEESESEPELEQEEDEELENELEKERKTKKNKGKKKRHSRKEYLRLHKQKCKET